MQTSIRMPLTTESHSSFLITHFMKGNIMSKIYKGTLGLIGNTPLVEVANIE